LRILILGAGGIGGYYGGRLAAAGADITFLVRPRRAAQLAEHGLVIKSPLGDFTTKVKTVTAETVAAGYGAIILGCKAYDLENAIVAIRPAAAPDAAGKRALILPQLNGMAHLARLDAEFGAERVLGGVAAIAVMLDPDGTVRHLNKLASFITGARHPAAEAACTELSAVLATGGFEFRHSQAIEQDMWEKWVFLCSLAAMCCLMRGNVGQIVRASPDGADLLGEMLEDCAAAAAAAGHAPSEASHARNRKTFADPQGPWEASMLRDLRAGYRVEADHVVGDMLARAKAAGRPATLLRAAYANLKLYEASLS
jgi:2-dehydropantoate 2-reductase